MPTCCLWCPKPATGTVKVEGLGRGEVCAQHHVNFVVRYGRERTDFRPGFDITRNSGRWTGD